MAILALEVVYDLEVHLSNAKFSTRRDCRKRGEEGRGDRGEGEREEEGDGEREEEEEEERGGEGTEGEGDNDGQITKVYTSCDEKEKREKIKNN